MTLAHRTFPSYQTRVVACFAAVVVLVLGAWIWNLHATLEEAAMDRQRASLEDVARATSMAIEVSDRPVEELLADVAADGPMRLTLVAEDGTVLADTEADAREMENNGDRPEVRAALAGEVGTDIRMPDTQGVDWMYVAVPADYRGAQTVLRASESLEQIAALSAQTRRSGLLALVVVLTITVAAAWRISASTTRPVESLAEVARAMADGELGTPIPADYGPLQPLSVALTELREQLRQRLGALDEERRTLEVALNGLSDAVLLLDGESVSLANRSATAMLPAAPGGLAGRDLDSIGLPASMVSAIRSRLQADVPSVAELGPDPYRRYHRVLVLPLGGGEPTRRTLVVTSDVTERMRLEAVRRDFVTNASHELKTPTAAILLLAEAADQAAADGDQKQALEFVSQIHAEANRLRQLVADLLDLSRIEGPAKPGRIADVRRAVDLALAGHRRASATKGLSLSADFTAVSGEDVAVAMDPTDLAVALDNLLSNAIAYTEEGAVTVSVAADDAEVSVEVADTGIGIPKKDLERVFERFYRVDRARSRNGGGTGLGLSLVRNAVERAGGESTIVSRPGGGTSVTLRLPRAR
ncbi:MAG: HAMP domain-containing histidine kinase [Actinobacteria bacterium]|nr:HAMP domain-containing histidine kinase [Actinomycetota bacterium]